MIQTKDLIKSIVRKLENSKSIVILTGAGVSAESGIKTFRDKDGLWAKFNPQELASINGFMSNPQLVWEWYQHRVEIINNTNPNEGHYAIAEMQNLFEDLTLVTQNVDGLHQASGSKEVIELHGSIVKNKCIDCNKNYTNKEGNKYGDLLHCHYCNGLIRPDVVWFGEMLPEWEIDIAQKKSKDCDIFFSIGTSAEVYPAAELPIIAKRNNALLVEINPKKTQLSDYADICINLLSGQALPLILDEYKKRL